MAELAYECRYAISRKPAISADNKARSPAAATIVSIWTRKVVKKSPERQYRKAKHKGVYLTAYGKTWMVKIKGKHVGTFPTEELAVKAAKEYRKSLKG